MVAGANGVAPCGPLFASLAETADMCADAEVHIAAAQPGELGESQAGLQRHEQERMVSSARPGARVGRRHQRVGLALGEERDLACLAALLGDGEHLLDRRRVFRVAVGGEAVEGTQRCQTGVAGADAVSPLMLQVVQEVAD